MIVSDRHRFVFVHIPKCAGTSVRLALMQHDDTGGRFDRRIEDIPGIGPVDLTHMPLDLLERVAPEIYARLAGGDYASYAVLRDPFERFPSAVAQRMKMFCGMELAQADRRTLEAEIARAIDHVGARPDDIAPDYIHFRRQADYVLRDGRRLVTHLYTPDRLEDLVADIAARAGAAPPERVRRANRTPALKVSALRSPLAAAGRVARAALPEGLHARMRRRLRRALMTADGAARPAAFDAPEVRAFIAEHYAADIALYRAVAGGTGRVKSDESEMRTGS